MGSGEMTIELRPKRFSGKIEGDKMNALYRLFAALDVNHNGEVDADPDKIKSEAWNEDLKGLLKEIEIFLDDKDDSNTVSFAEFVDEFSKSHVTTREIENLADNFTAALTHV